MRRVVFITVADRAFFPGTLAAVNSILKFHPDADIKVVCSGLYNEPLTAEQQDLLGSRAQVLLHSFFEKPGRILAAWQLKAYAAADIGPDYDLVVGFDSDALLCAPLDDIIEATLEDGRIRGGKDGGGASYDETYSAYGISGGSFNAKYVSTSWYFCPIDSDTVELLHDWARCSDLAVYGPQDDKRFPGHGDQGVLNALLYSRNMTDRVELLENRLWSQHWTYEQDVVIFKDGGLYNASFGAKMRVAHVGGWRKFWNRDHADWVRAGGLSQSTTYVWFLYCFWFGTCQDWQKDPYEYLPNTSRHLCRELLHFYYQLAYIGKDVPKRWHDLTPSIFERMLDDSSRMMVLGEEMSKYQALGKFFGRKRIVEVGSYLGGSALALAASLMPTNVTVYAVESFMGDLDGSTGGWELPSMRRYNEESIEKYPFLRLLSVPVASSFAVQYFEDRSCDLVFIDLSSGAENIAAELAAWRPKIRIGGAMAGTLNNEVMAAVRSEFEKVEVDEGVWISIIE
jgi:hypothetical protein